VNDPQPPQNVTAIKADGTEIPVDLVYEGQNEDGLHVWTSVRDLPDETVRLHADVFPGRTVVRFR
jgi:hypothetical protein